MKKKIAIICLMLASLLFCCTALAMTVEEVEPIPVANGLIVKDYGFAAADSEGRIQRLFGHVLEKDEQDLMEIMDWKPCFYCKVENSTDETINARFYIRSVRKSGGYWNKKAPVAAHEEYTFFGGGRKADKPSKYAGAYSVDFTGKKKDVIRFELFME